MRIGQWISEKIAPGPIYGSRGTNTAEQAPLTPFTIEFLKKNAIANRCLNMIIDAASSIEYEIISGKKLESHSKKRPENILHMMNRVANAQMDANFFRRCLISDILVSGNAFVLVDGDRLFYIPASGMTVLGDEKNLVKGYELNGEIKLKPEEVIHIKDNSTHSMRMGQSRLESLREALDLHKRMKDFQRNFFSNNAMPGVVLVSPNTLTEKIKERKLQQWQQDYNPFSGARKPAFLDGGIDIKNLTTSTFREMDFENSIKTLESQIARNMGVPPILLDGGNNANITPNHRLFYLETIMPICDKIAAAFALHYGYDIRPISVGVPALQPDLRDLANYVSTIVNGGIISPEEGRIELGFPLEVTGTIRVPQNIAGSASNPSEGGRPKEPDEGGE